MGKPGGNPENDGENDGKIRVRMPVWLQIVREIWVDCYFLGLSGDVRGNQLYCLFVSGNGGFPVDLQRMATE